MDAAVTSVDAAVTSVDAAVTSVDAAVTSVDAAVTSVSVSQETGVGTRGGYTRRTQRVPDPCVAAARPRRLLAGTRRVHASGVLPSRGLTGG